MHHFVKCPNSSEWSYDELVFWIFAWRRISASRRCHQEVLISVTKTFCLSSLFLPCADDVWSHIWNCYLFLELIVLLWGRLFIERSMSVIFRVIHPLTKLKFLVHYLISWNCLFFKANYEIWLNWYHISKKKKEKDKKRQERLSLL